MDRKPKEPSKLRLANKRLALARIVLSPSVPESMIDLLAAAYDREKRRIHEHHRHELAEQRKAKS